MKHITSTSVLSISTPYKINYIEIINQHMIDGTNPNSNPIPDGFEDAGAYPLHLAVLKGNVEIIKMLKHVQKEQNDYEDHESLESQKYIKLINREKS